MRFFGPIWDVPATAGQPHVPTPVGVACGFCRIEIAEGDRGFILDHVSIGPAGEPVAIEFPWHRECLMRSTIGSPAHLEGRCTCHGGEPETAAQTPKQLRAEAIDVWERITGRPAHLP